MSLSSSLDSGSCASERTPGAPSSGDRPDTRATIALKKARKKASMHTVEIPSSCIPAKRERSSSDQSALDRPTRTHKWLAEPGDFGAADGNLFLKIEETLFKVHASRLIKESPWFECLLSCTDVPKLPKDEGDSFGWTDIDRVLETKCQNEGLDLYVLDFPGGAVAREFAALLRAMDAAIDYAFVLPDFDTLLLIYRAALFWKMERYQSFCTRALTRLYTDHHSFITLKPLPSAAIALELGIISNTSSVLRRAFYDVAREPLSTENENKTSTSLSELRIEDLIILLKVQKYLASVSSVIVLSLNNECTGDECIKKHVAKFTTPVTCLHPLDPILAIRKFLEVNWKSQGYCEMAERAVKQKLDELRSSIWTGLHDLIFES